MPLDSRCNAAAEKSILPVFPSITQFHVHPNLRLSQILAASSNKCSSNMLLLDIILAQLRRDPGASLFACQSLKFSQICVYCSSTDTAPGGGVKILESVHLIVPYSLQYNILHIDCNPPDLL